MTKYQVKQCLRVVICCIEELISLRQYEQSSQDHAFSLHQIEYYHSEILRLSPFEIGPKLTYSDLEGYILEYIEEDIKPLSPNTRKSVLRGYFKASAPLWDMFMGGKYIGLGSHTSELKNELSSGALDFCLSSIRFIGGFSIGFFSLCNRFSSSLWTAVSDNEYPMFTAEKVQEYQDIHSNARGLPKATKVSMLYAVFDRLKIIKEGENTVAFSQFIEIVTGGNPNPGKSPDARKYRESPTLEASQKIEVWVKKLKI